MASIEEKVEEHYKAILDRGCVIFCGRLVQG